jgi:hypothetical protein
LTQRCQSTLSSNISVNSILFAKTFKGVKQCPRGRCLTEKPRGQKSRETVSLRKPLHQFEQDRDIVFLYVFEKMCCFLVTDA